MTSKNRLAAHLTAGTAALVLTACTSSNSAAQEKKPIAAPQESKAAAPLEPPSETKPLLLVYPQDKAVIASSSSFLIGSCLPPGELTVNGNPVALNKQGYFAHVVQLAYGTNRFELTYKGSSTVSQLVEIVREKPRQPISPAKFMLAKDSLEPKDDLSYKVGDYLEFACRATPQAQVTVALGRHRIALAPIGALRAVRRQAGKKSVPGSLASINKGLDAAYGQVFQKYPASPPDLYVGLYQIEEGDNFNQEHPLFTLSQGGKSTAIALGTSITVIRQPLIARTVHDDTIVRVIPDGGRLTPLPQGVRLTTDGMRGENIRVLYSGNKHVWIKRDELEFEQPGAPAPQAVARTILVNKDNYGEMVSVPLSQRLPFTVEQSVSPNKLTLKIYGAGAETDWAYQAPVGEGNASVIEDVSFKQPDDHTYEVDIELKGGRQWGYFADYLGNTLNLHIKYPPILASAGDGQTGNRLKGLTICLDPGHGGLEHGAVGPSGVWEKDVNLALALKLRDLLKGEGATVLMTREDDSDVSLNDRVAFAVKRKVDLLVSVHNNALPDGRDPIKEHGTSAYFYHPQSKELARSMKGALAKEMSLPDIGARFQNLALCRPSGMPAVLVEVAFMSNPDEYAKLINPSWQNNAAHSMLGGILNYFNRGN